ncbi:D-alanyl-D-alanine carboxypeptidase family protein [Parablautia intestinalis]|uniref:D-alanyl-D-alanine carboxypeptidase family protein n=1 Tax=Parablautia intestinalis TaxID=2320100 RepID=A0A3A9AEM9_9FIRM|nr:M15 family metallopeptidase [Parablautia intestinalis]RKI90052.1 D-alanyl-D-alanine carboxypeptidase family protein [Parablautia intestinalis]
MENKSYKKIIRFFIDMGRRGRLWRIPAVAGLAVSMFMYQLYEHGRKKTRRFACVIFILCCFVTANSFAFPVFYEEGGFVSAQEKAETRADTADIASALVQAKGAGLQGETIVDGNTPLSKEVEENGEVKKDNSDRQDQKEQIVFDKDDWRLMLINKQHPIPADYSFTLGPIKTMKGTMKCDERIIEDLLSMIQDAGDEGINLAICSPYRDMNRQKVLFNRKIKTYMASDMTYMEAYKLASQTVTVPGASEHQVGLAIDIVADYYLNLDEGFAETEAGIWLVENCAEYGFVLRYPKGKEYITSIEFEPWHFRYVGKEAAGIMMEEGLCLEEFWEKYL